MNYPLQDDGTEISPPFIAELKTPFFEGGRLKTILSWLEHPNCEENKLKWQKGTVSEMKINYFFVFSELAATISCPNSFIALPQPIAPSTIRRSRMCGHIGEFAI
jgi:hypothetical protein